MVNRYLALDHRIRLDRILAEIKRINPKKIVDFGCGETPIQDLDLGLYVGIDNNRNAINFDKFDRPGFHYIESNYEKPLDIKERFDLAIWSEGPEHTLKHDAVFNNIRRLLEKDGFLILTCPNQRSYEIISEEAEHKCKFGFESLKKLVEDNGFKILEISEVNCCIPKHLRGYQWLFCLAIVGEYDPRYKWGV